MLQVQTFPQDLGNVDVDRKQMRRCLFTGLFEETVEVGQTTRTFYTYLKAGLVYNQPCLVVAPPDNVPVLEYLEHSPWMALAEAHDLFLHVLVPAPQGWDLGGADADYMNQVYVQINSRHGYVVVQDNIYAFGVGRGATVAQQAVMKMSSEWSGLATFGDLAPQALLNVHTAAGAVSTEKSELIIAGTKVQVPVWMAWKENTGTNAAVCDYWKTTNDSNPEPYSNRWADEVYFPSVVCKKSQINEEKISQVRVTNHFQGTLQKDFLEAVWAYLGKACRHRCFGTKALRNRIDPDAYGFTHHTMELDGFTRVWYEYVPERVQASGKPAPLVVCLHGRGSSAECFMSLADMSRVAEERDFILLYPESSIHQQRPGAVRNLLRWNGNYKGQPIDDVKFVLEVVADIKTRWPIDPTRIYACGQSSGGVMASTLAQRAPNVFAAVACWSGLLTPGKLQLPERIDPAVPFLFLLGEKDWLCVDSENGELEYHVVKNIAAFLRNLMQLYGLRTVPKRYDCGEISYYVYPNEKEIPLLIVGTVRDMSHANYPAESWYSYDGFLSKFSKDPDGTLLYMGEPAL